MVFVIIMKVPYIVLLYRRTIPACPFSPIHPVLAHLTSAADDYRVSVGDLLTALSSVPDPRARRGVRRQIPTIVAVALCAVLARSAVGDCDWRMGCQLLSAGAGPRRGIGGVTVGHHAKYSLGDLHPRVRRQS